MPLALSVLLAVGLHVQLRAQVPPVGEDSGFPVPGASLVYLDLDWREGPTPAVEVSLLDTEPRLWRAGFTAGLISSVRGTVYGYGGLQVPIPLPLGLVARPSLAAGFYMAGRGVDLGHALEFRSALLLERKVTDRLRLSMVYFHLSNAGITHPNPGMEGLGLGVAYAPPFAR